MTNRFNWNDSEDVVVRSYGDIACFPNERGDVVLRQEDQFMEDEPVIIVPLDSVQRLVNAILFSARQGHEIRGDLQANDGGQSQSDGQTVLALPAPPTNARAATSGARRTSQVGQHGT